MLEEYLVQDCELITTTRDEYGDRIYSTATTLKCRFRDITTVRRQSHREIEDADSMLWLKNEDIVDNSIIRGSIIKFDSTYFQIERFNKARRLGETEIQFVKCDLKILDIGVS